jgi:nitrate/TMAO reductase-like tetraheme cytochrome c subunit
MPHPGGETNRCRLCHADGLYEAPKTKHLDEADCYTCHQSQEYRPWPPALSHEVTDTSPGTCLECHKELSHAERPNCVGCHAL